MKNRLADISKGRDNNLDLLRFIAAIMVIFSHAFPISLGADVMDPLAVMTKDQISFGSLAVSVFFLYGGFLICKSLFRCKETKKYFKARIIRIFPPLMVVVILCSFCLGPFYTVLSIPDYFTSAGTYRYLLNGILILQHNLPGVFENNIYGAVVNGPLWTLPIEFVCYIMCWFFYKINILDKKRSLGAILIFGLGCTGVLILSEKYAILATMIRPMGMFFIGMMLYIYLEHIVMSRFIFWLCLAGCIVSSILGIFNYTIFIFLPYLLMYIGFGTKFKFSDFAKRGEISYGIYLSAWPVQQMICQYFGGQMNPVLNFILAIIPSIFMGIIICKFVEKPVTRKFKN